MGGGESDGVLGWSAGWAVCRPLRGTPSLERLDPPPTRVQRLPHRERLLLKGSGRGWEYPHPVEGGCWKAPLPVLKMREGEGEKHMLQLWKDPLVPALQQAQDFRRSTSD